MNQNKGNFWDLTITFFGRILDAVRTDQTLAILWGFGVLLLIILIVVLMLASLTPEMQLLVIVMILCILAFLFVYTLRRSPQADKWSVVKPISSLKSNSDAKITESNIKNNEIILRSPSLPDPLDKDALERYILEWSRYNFEKNAVRYHKSIYGSAHPMQRTNLFNLLKLLKPLFGERFSKPESWLDAGCGTGLMLAVAYANRDFQWLLNPDIKIRAGFDNSSKMREIAIKGSKEITVGYTRVFAGDLLKISSEELKNQVDQSYVDLIIANNVIHWLFTKKNIDTAFRNIHDLLKKKGGLFAATIAADDTASIFLESYKTIMSSKINTKEVNIWSSHLNNPIGLQNIHDIIEIAKKNKFRVEVAQYVYEPVQYNDTDEYVEDVRAYGDCIFMAPVIQKSAEEINEIWREIRYLFRQNYRIKYGQSRYVHDQYMIYLIVSRED